MNLDCNIFIYRCIDANVAAEDNRGGAKCIEVSLSEDANSLKQAVNIGLNQNLVNQSSNPNDIWNACGMSKERVVVAKPTFLTPQSISKIYGKLPTKRSKKKPKVLKIENTDQSIAENSTHLDSDYVTSNSNTPETFADSVSESSCVDSECNDRALTNASSYSVSSIKDNCGIQENSGSPILCSDKTCDHAVFDKGSTEATKESVQISPSLTFPVSKIYGDDFQQNSRVKNSSSFLFERDSLADDTESLDQSSEVSSCTFSSVSLNQEIKANPELYSHHHGADVNKFFLYTIA